MCRGSERHGGLLHCARGLVRLRDVRLLRRGCSGLRAGLPLLASYARPNVPTHTTRTRLLPASALHVGMRPSCYSVVYLGRNVQHHATADGMYLWVSVVVFYVVVFLFPALWTHSYWYVIDKFRTPSSPGTGISAAACAVAGP